MGLSQRPVSPWLPVQGNQAEDAVLPLPSTPDPRTSAVVCPDDPLALAVKGVGPQTTDMNLHQ